MAYDKQTWTTGEVITQEKLNHMEDGIEDAYELPAVTSEDDGKFLGVENGAWSVVNGGSGGVLVVNMNKTEEGDTNILTLDKTWQEIVDACSTRGAVVKQEAENGYALTPITQIRGGSGLYSVILMVNEFTTESPNGYPTLSGDR